MSGPNHSDTLRGMPEKSIKQTEIRWQLVLQVNRATATRLNPSINYVGVIHTSLV